MSIQPQRHHQHAAGTCPLVHSLINAKDYGTGLNITQCIKSTLLKLVTCTYHNVMGYKSDAGVIEREVQHHSST